MSSSCAPIIDSMGMLQLVAFLQEQFGIEISTRTRPREPRLGRACRRLRGAEAQPLRSLSFHVRHRRLHGPVRRARVRAGLSCRPSAPNDGEPAAPRPGRAARDPARRDRARTRSARDRRSRRGSAAHARPFASSDGGLQRRIFNHVELRERFRSTGFARARTRRSSGGYLALGSPASASSTTVAFASGIRGRASSGWPATASGSPPCSTHSRAISSPSPPRPRHSSRGVGHGQPSTPRD
jgi:hypothetical protein